MLARLFRIAVSFTIVLVAYWSYALAVVPFIEPPAKERETIVVDPSGNPDDDTELDPLLEMLRPHLPPGGWEFDPQTMIVANDQFTLLIHDYETVDDDKVKLQRCSLVFFPDGEPSIEKPDPNVLVIRASDGAILQFADGVDLDRLKLGKMQGGLLQGRVTIEGNLSRDQPAPAADDGADGVAPDAPKMQRIEQRLMLATRDVHMSEDRIWTDNEVHFALGQNHGSGRKLNIEMAEVEEIHGARSEKKREVQSIEITEEVKLQLAMAAGENPFDASASQASTAATTEPTGGANTAYVDITSVGPFRFDALRQIATFEDNVDVVRSGADGPVDQLSCELLSVFFASGEQSDMEPTRIEAAGHPVIGRRGGEDAELRCEHLAYHLDSGEISLKSTDQVLLRRGTDLVRAASVRYQPGPNGSIGEMLASGRGELKANLPGQESKNSAAPNTAASTTPLTATANSPNAANKTSRVHARWTKELRLRPHEGKTLLSVLGDASVRFAEMGTLSSNEIWMWLIEQPSDAVTQDENAPRYTPHSMLANGRVTIDSEQLIGITERLEMWFSPTKNLAIKNNSNSSQANNRSSAAGPGAPSSSLAANGPDKKPTRYQVRGDLIRVQVASDGRRTALRDVTIKGDVEMRQQLLAGPAPQQPPLLVRGDSLQLLGADVENTKLFVTGSDTKQALVEARGLVLSGAKIEGNRAANSLEVNGPGWMTLPMNRDLAGHGGAGLGGAGQPAVTDDAPLKINWRGGMRFDGQRVTFREHVLATTAAQTVRTSKLIATLTRDIDFTNPGKVDDIGLSHIQCPSLVSLESRTIEEGQVQSIDRLEMHNLRIDQATGDLQASGPGWVKTHRFGSQMTLEPGAPGPAPPAAQPNASELIFLRVDFQQSLTGNLRQKRLSFLNQVKCVYGPVRDWQQELATNGFNKPGPREVLLSCDRLMVQEMPGVRRGERTVDLDAIGNMRVDGEQFTATGNRLSYNTGKEMLTLEGTPQRDAKLAQTKPGGKRANFAAQKIWYWRNRNHVKVDGVRFLDVQ